MIELWAAYFVLVIGLVTGLVMGFCWGVVFAIARYRLRTELKPITRRSQ